MPAGVPCFSASSTLSCEESQPPAPSSMNSAVPSHRDGHDHLKPGAKLKLSSQMLSFVTYFVSAMTH